MDFLLGVRQEIIVACIVLHKIAVRLILPLPDDDGEDPAVDNNNDHSIKKSNSRAN